MNYTLNVILWAVMASVAVEYHWLSMSVILSLSFVWGNLAGYLEGYKKGLDESL